MSKEKRVKNIVSKIDIIQANATFLFFLGLTVLLLIIKKVFHKRIPLYFRLIPLYIFLIIFQLAFSSYFVFANAMGVGKKSPINISAYVFIILEYSIFAILLSKFIRSVLLKKYLAYSCIVFTVVAIILWYTVSPFEKNLSIITTIESFSLIPFCIYYFYELLNYPLLKITEDRAFWITTGILFLFVCITPFYLALEYFGRIREMQMIDYFGYDLIVLFLAKACLIKSKTVKWLA